MSELSNCRVAILASDGFEESELTEPLRALRGAGARVEIISANEKGDTIQGFRHHDKSIRLERDRSLPDSDPADYDALMLPGGALNADSLRANPEVLKFVTAFEAEGKPIAFICHAPWVLVSAGLVKDRTLTGYETIQDDIRNAGGNYVDQPVVVDNNWVSSRKPADLPEFAKEMIQTFTQFLGQHERTSEKKQVA
ncbi:MAG TPA: protease [Bdellovibrionales bacterium]|nr:MAG: protease [Bdellovibrionales bacterium GWB1_52_6]OFZ03759.1 MAG: protease [Bdellovibrionales bacterium GWA1_52_35]OFZ41780.1 MAG: protease [Bdellovibrionales bacterium GWC1_52_8]HAR43368.1 protease [Bdellovibrionales bacterium]HCM38724.1 protease [Bdellovibrionales bacterium]